MRRNNRELRGVSIIYIRVPPAGDTQLEIHTAHTHIRHIDYLQQWPPDWLVRLPLEQDRQRCGLELR